MSQDNDTGRGEDRLDTHGALLIRSPDELDRVSRELTDSGVAITAEGYVHDLAGVAPDVSVSEATIDSAQRAGAA